MYVCHFSGIENLFVRSSLCSRDKFSILLTWQLVSTKTRLSLWVDRAARDERSWTWSVFNHLSCIPLLSTVKFNFFWTEYYTAIFYLIFHLIFNQIWISLQNYSVTLRKSHWHPLSLTDSETTVHSPDEQRRTSTVRSTVGCCGGWGQRVQLQTARWPVKHRADRQTHG